MKSHNLFFAWKVFHFALFVFGVRVCESECVGVLVVLLVELQNCFRHIGCDCSPSARYNVKKRKTSTSHLNFFAVVLLSVSALDSTSLKKTKQNEKFRFFCAHHCICSWRRTCDLCVRDWVRTIRASIETKRVNYFAHRKFPTSSFRWQHLRQHFETKIENSQHCLSKFSKIKWKNSRFFFHRRASCSRQRKRPFSWRGRSRSRMCTFRALIQSKIVIRSIYLVCCCPMIFEKENENEFVSSLSFQFDRLQKWVVD